MRTLQIIYYILVLIGALNWGLVGLMDIDLVALVFGQMTIAARFIYTIIAISAILSLITSYREIF